VEVARLSRYDRMASSNDPASSSGLLQTAREKRNNKRLGMQTTAPCRKRYDVQERRTGCLGVATVKLRAMENDGCARSQKMMAPIGVERDAKSPNRRRGRSGQARQRIYI